ncbi:MAG: ExbD/TolR family protein [Planctomycetota bacterium]|jgi:biopolymer transport protein ExbD
MARGSPAKTDEEVKLQITPLIDIVFLLLIFFMCAMKFKTLERKVAAFLPKDRGLAKTKIKLEEKPKITVELKRKKGEKGTRVKLLDSMIGIDDKGFQELDRRIKQISAADKTLPGEINAWAEVPHGDVVRAIDAFMKNEVFDITFVGAPPPGVKQSGPGDPDAR